MKKKIFASLLCAMTLAFTGCTSNSNNNASNSNTNSSSEATEDIAIDFDDVIITIDDTEITKREYMIYAYTTTNTLSDLYGSTLFDASSDLTMVNNMIFEQSLDTIQSVIAMLEYAEENNIELDATDRIDVATASTQLSAQISEEDFALMGLDASTIIPLMEDSFLYAKAFDALIDEFKVTDEEYETYFEENKEELLKDYTAMSMNSIYLYDQELAQEVFERATTGGEDFTELFLENDISEQAKASEDQGRMQVFQNEFFENFPELDDNVAVDDVFGPIDIGGIHAVFLIEALDSPTDEELREMSDTIFLQTGQMHYGQDSLDALLDAQTVSYDSDLPLNLEQFYGEKESPSSPTIENVTSDSTPDSDPTDEEDDADDEDVSDDADEKDTE